MAIGLRQAQRNRSVKLPSPPLDAVRLFLPRERLCTGRQARGRKWATAALMRSLERRRSRTSIGEARARPRGRISELRLPVLFELNPSMYDPAAPYALHYDLVLVKSPRPSLDPTGAVFRDGRPRPVVAHDGVWWLFDASR